jgi:hypothetical protein
MSARPTSLTCHAKIRTHAGPKKTGGRQDDRRHPHKIRATAPPRAERTGASGDEVGHAGKTPAVARTISAPYRRRSQPRKSLSGYGANAPPGREAACQNEILRELRRLLQHSCRVDGGSSRTSVSIHGLGYLLTALMRQGLIPDELVLQLATFLCSHDLFLELRVRTPRTLTANQARQGGKQGTDGRQRSRIHFRCLALNFTAAEPPAQRLTTSLTSRSFWSGRRCRGLRGRRQILRGPTSYWAAVQCAIVCVQ